MRTGTEQRTGLVILVILIALGADIFTGIASSTKRSTSSSLLTQIESGCSEITIPEATTFGTLSVTFNPAFPGVPNVWVVPCGGAGYPEFRLIESYITMLSATSGLVLTKTLTTTKAQVLTTGSFIIDSVGASTTFARPIGISVQANVTAITGIGTGWDIWAQGYDCSISSWENLSDNGVGNNPDLGSAFPTGHSSGSEFNVNQTLIDKSLNNGCFASNDNANAIFPVRIVGSTATLTKTISFDRLVLVLYYPSTSVSFNHDSQTANGMTVFAQGMSGTYAVQWQAQYPCLNSQGAC